MDLQHPIRKAFYVAFFFGITWAPTRETAHDAASGSGLSRGVAPADLTSARGPTVAETTALTCEAGMVLVEGEHCSEVEQICVRWMDPPPYQNLRCGEYAKPARCKSGRQHRRFCIDREEFSEPAGGTVAPDALPVVNKKWGEAKALCEARGARLCREAEWEFACEGPDMSPYPYGFRRDATICNFDKTDLGGPMEKLKDLRAPVSGFPECRSPFGVHHMVGNVDEWVERENMSAPYRSALRGGWWLPGRNRCRAATTAHDETYAGKQVGFRCCKDAPAAAPPGATGTQALNQP